MHENIKIVEKAVLVGVHTDAPDPLLDTTEESLAELADLAETAGAQVLATMVQNRPSPDKTTYIGEGKLDELKTACHELEANMVIFDDGLTGSQIRNIENALGDITVIDRNTLILDIFAQRAQTREGKIQVELAQLRYMLPRLIGLGNQLSRLGGGIGTRGPGESKLESDRRHIRRRLEYLEADLKEIEKHRNMLRERRKKDSVSTVALVGYTNAGKSSLLNVLTGSDVTERNRLFETLDPTSRARVLPDNRDILLVDTVGFIRRLPHQFIEAFKSTLEEAAVADVLIHVIDASNPQMLYQMEVVENLLDELGCSSTPTIAAFNKCDRLTESEIVTARTRTPYAGTVKMSVRTKDGLSDLMVLLDETVPGKKIKAHLCIPYERGSLVADLHQTEVVLSEAYTDNGTVLDVLLDPILWSKYAPYGTKE